MNRFAAEYYSLESFFKLTQKDHKASKPKTIGINKGGPPSPFHTWFTWRSNEKAQQIAIAIPVPKTTFFLQNLNQYLTNQLVVGV